MTTEEIENELRSLSDNKYGEFTALLVPTVCRERIIGVRIPILRNFAKRLLREGQAEGFLADLPHKHYDENILHGAIVSGISDYGRVVSLLDRFLPFVDNWAVCDTISPAVFKKNRAKLRLDAERWICSDLNWTSRFGIRMAMAHFLDEDYEPKFFEKVAKTRSGEYYLDMMRAWFFATALSKRWDDAAPWIARLDDWTKAKAVQKAIESRRISPEQKEALRKIRKPLAR